MKLLQKILAVILSMALVLVAFPFAVFADKPDPKQVETPRYTSDIGVGASGSVTITLSLSTISELLGALGDRDELKAKLEAMMVKEGDLITIGDIMEIVPFEAVLEIILGESGTGLGTLVERLGGAHAVLDMVDVDQIILSATRETDAVDPSVHPLENVINIITALEGFEATVNTGAVLALDLPISFVELYNYVDLDKLRDKFASLSYSDKLAIFSDFDGFVEALVAGLKAGTLEDGNGDPLTFGQMLDPTRADPDNVNAVVNDLIALDSDLLAIVVSDVLNAGLNVPAGAYTVDLDMVKSVLNENAGFKTALIADILNPANDVLTTDGMEALMDLVDTTVIAAAAVSLFGAHDDYYVLDDVIASFTPAGQTRLYQLGGATPSKEDALQVLTEDIDADYTLQYFDVAALQSAITDAGRAATAEKLLNDGLLNIAPADLNAFISNGSYYNFANFASRVVARIDANGVALDSVATFTAAELIADPDILDFLCGKLGDYFERFTVSQILGVADAHGGMEQFLSTGIYTNESLIDLALTYENDAYLYISVSDMVEALLDGSLSNLPSVLKDGESFATILQDGTVITVDEVMTCIRASGNPLQTFVDFDAIFTILEAHPDKMGNLLKQVETDVLAEQFSDNMKEIFEALTKAQYSDLINLVLASGEVCITRVLLAGYEVAKRNDISGLLEFNFDAIVAALWEIVPKFEEIGDDGFNGVLTAFNFRMFYETVSGVDKEKDINVTIKMAGDLENVRRVAKVLDRYIKLEKTNNYFQLTINVPSYVTDLYRYVLEEGDSEAVVSLRQKLLAMECLTGAEIAEALSELPFSEVVAGLRDIDVNHLYERIVATGMVEKLLQKMDQYFGLHVSMESMETLDTVLEHFRSDNLSTIADLIHHVTVRTGDDLMAALEKVAKVADENEYAQRLINRAASIPVFGKFFENFDAEDLLAEYKDMDPVEAIVRYATEKLEYDFLSEFYSDQTAAELYQSGLDYAEAHLGEAYEDLCLLISHLMDPGYVPQTEREERIWSLIPQIVLDRASDHSLLSCYRGNGTFSATRDCADLSVTNLSERFVNLAARFVSMSDDLKAYALTLLPAGTFYYAANLTVNFSGLYQVDYYKKDGTLWFSTFLPEEIDPKVVPLPVEEKFQANDWTDAPDGTGEVVEKITGDQALYPSYTELFTVNYEYDNAVIGSEQVLDGELLANLPADPDLPDNDHNWALGYFVNDVEIDPATYPVTEDITVTLKYIQLTDTVTWKNGDEVIYEEEVAFGETPVYDEATYGTPEKAATAQFTYAFIGWSPDIDPLTGAVVYTAQFSETTNKYTVTWKNGETVIYSEEVEFGETPVYNGATPAGYADKYYTYTFSGWTPDVVAVTEAATYSAKFDATAKTFTIFVKIMPTNSTISIQDVTGETTIAELKAILATETGYPVAQQKLVYGGTLLDDDKTLAEYNIEKEFILRLFLQTYTVTWKNGDEIIYAEEVEYGVVPEYDTATYGTPAKAGTAQVSYTFTGWGEIAAVTGEAVYSAQFSETTNKYTVTWKNGDEVIYSEEVEYGVVPEYDTATYGTPEKAATAQFTYTFTGFGEIVAVTGEAVYSAQFSETTNKYTVTWKNGDEVIYSEEVEYGVVPEYDTATYGTPAKTATAQFTYTFTGFGEIVAVTGEAVYSAQFSETTNKYTVTWKNGEEVIYSEEVEYGVVPEYDTATYGTPEKAATAQFTYTFTGFGEIAAVTGEAVYSAQFSETTNKYTVTWKNGEEVIYSEEVEYGVVPEYDEATYGTPEKAATAQFTYTFTGFGEIVAVTGEAVYSAQFSETTNKYTVTWKNGDTTIYSEEVEYGVVPEYDTATYGTPAKAATAQFTYTFTGFGEIVAVTGEAVYSAQFSETTNKYTVTWKNGEEVIYSEEVEYGVVPEYDTATYGTPAKAGTAQVSYTFTGWGEIVAVTGEAVYSAQFSETTNKYTVTWKNGDTTIYSEEVEYGAVPEYDTATYGTPEKAATAEYTYTFKGWEPAVSAVTGAAVYTAQFTESPVLPVGTPITVRYWNGETYEEIELNVPEGATLDDVLELLPAWTPDETIVGGGENYVPHFFTIGEDGRIEITDQVPGATVAEADKDYIILYYPEYIESATADDAGEKPLFIDLTTDAEGNWTITVSDALVVGEDGALVRTTDAENPNTFTLKIDTEAPDFAQAESLTVQYGDGAKIEISGALLDQIQQEGNGKMLLSIKPADTEGRTFDSVEGSVIPFVNAPAKEIYDLELLIKVYDDQPNSGEKIADFEGGMAITVKPTVIMVLKETGGWKTNAYILEGTTATADDLQVAVSEADGTVTFRPPHFTEVVLVNEYFLDLFFEGSTEEGAYTINGKTVNAAGGYVPEGATLKAVTPSLSEAADEHNLIDTMTFGEEEAEIGGDFILGSAPVALTTYTIAKDAPVTFGGEEVEAPIGSVLPYEISLKPGEKLSALPEGATLLEIIEKPDGSKVYVFAVTVTPALPPITYQIEQITTNEYYITNGIAGDRQEGVTYKSTKDTTFSTGTYFLDLRTEEKGGASLLLLWIVLIVLLVAAIIAMLYLIIIKKGLGPNLFTKIITGIVKAFFLVCLGAYMIFSFKIFRKAK